MKAIVIYDSQYGFTEEVAKAVGAAMGAEVKVQKIGETDAAGLAAYDLIVIGSPTQGGRYTAAMKAFLEKIPQGALKKKNAAAFDTRLKTPLVRLFGYAAGRIAEALKKQGANLVVPAEPFLVKSAKGPLAEGEAEHAAAWGKTLLAAVKAAGDTGAGLLDRP